MLNARVKQGFTGREELTFNIPDVEDHDCLATTSLPRGSA